MDSNVILGNGEVVGGGKAFLFRSVLGIRLNVHSKYFSGNRRDDLVRGHRSVAAYRMTAHREGTGGTNIGIKQYRKCGLMLDTQSEVVPRRLAGHVLCNRDEISGPDVATSQPCSATVKLGHLTDFGISR